MSTRSRSRSSSSSSSRSRNNIASANSQISDRQISDLVSKLQCLIPEIRNSSSHKVSASNVLQEICNYIRNLHREVEDLSERLSQLLAATEYDSAEAAIIRTLFIN